MINRHILRPKNCDITKRNKMGEFMHKITVKSGLFVAKHKILFYILSYTWGILTTLAGWCILAFVNIFYKKKIKEKGKFFTAHYIMFGNNWGGFESGTNFLIADQMGADYTIHSKCHELGHTYQSAVWGPFTILLFTIPSIIRYWYQCARQSKNKPNVPYDVVYFESSATEIGETLLTEKENKDYHYYNAEFKKNNNYKKVIKTK